MWTHRAAATGYEMHGILERPYTEQSYSSQARSCDVLGTRGISDSRNTALWVVVRCCFAFMEQLAFYDQRLDRN